jgi:pimeloyl-ACP methyl ester carboxylesterase
VKIRLTKFLFYVFLLITFQGPCAKINLSEEVLIGGIRQWITLKGLSDKDPVILFLHGGPGSSVMTYADQFTSELQKKFIVVQWDQRETGRTKQLSGSPLPLTVALFQSDAVEMISYLKTRFARERIYLMGHSWGGFLALLVASRHPELLDGVFAISPMVWQAESERQTLDIMKRNAKAENNQEEVSELATVSVPFVNGTQLYYQRKWMAKLMGQKSFSQTFVKNWATRWLPLFNEACQVNFFMTAPEIDCALYFFVGDEDYQTYFKLTEEYFQAVKAPAKEIFWFDHSAHAFLVSGQKKLQEIIMKLTLPNNPN